MFIFYEQVRFFLLKKKNNTLKRQECVELYLYSE